ncbi:MAG: hypothetical protein WD875_19500 [Pirellulales bacterium]
MPEAFMPKLTAGKSIVALLVVLGATLAAVNVWHRYATTNRIHGLWGAETMELIARAPQAEWLELVPGEMGRAEPDSSDSKPSTVDRDNVYRGSVDPSADKGDDLFVDGKRYRAVDRGDLITARGFLNLRYALGQNGSYNWSCDAGPPDTWRWAMIFVEGDRRAVLLVDEDCGWIAALPAANLVVGENGADKLAKAKAVETTTQFATGLKAFFAEQASTP